MRTVKQYIVFLILLVMPALGTAQVAVDSCEYWIDGNFDKRKCVAFTDSLELVLDFSDHVAGMHSLWLRVSDSDGYWSSPIMKFFVKDFGIGGGSLRSYRYWIDNDITLAVTGMCETGVAELELDMQVLSKGVHALSLQFEDSNGMFSAPITKFFVKNFDISGGSLRSYRYWIDNDITLAVTGMCETGVAELELDMQVLSKGVHALSLQFEDSNGMFSAPITKFFVVPETVAGENKIVAYEYWFNKGERKRVEVEPSNPFLLDGVLIDIVGVVPNEISSDYRFDVVQRSVLCKDSVFLGLQTFDANGKASAAVLSDTFCIDVPVEVDFITLENDIPEVYEMPQMGRVKGFEAHSMDGDSLTWYTKGNCIIDFFSENGNRVNVTNCLLGDTLCVHKMKAEGNVTYMLAYSKQPEKSLCETKCVRSGSTSIDWGAEDYMSVATANGEIIVNCHKLLKLAVYDTMGREVVSQFLPKGDNRIPMPSGAYTVKVETIVIKVFVP